MAHQHIRQYQNAYTSESYRFRLPSIEKTHKEKESRQIQDDSHSPFKRRYFHDEYQELINENNLLKQRLMAQSDEHYYNLKSFEESTNDIINLQRNEIRKILNKNHFLEREIDALMRVLNNNNNNTDDEKKLWIKDANERISFLQNKLKKSTIVIETMKHENAVLEQRLSTTLVLKENEVKQCKLKIKELEEELTESKQQLTEARELASKNIKRSGKDGKRQEGRPDVERSVVNDAHGYQLKIETLNKQVQHLLTKLQDTKAELNETKTRLSKVMGERLTDNNPNIADLTDRNRPTKLAERYAELYDNQWTDAFDVLMKEHEDEETTIETLFKILQDIEHFCKTNAQEQMIELRRVMELSDVHTRQDMSTDVKKILKDCRKAMSSSSIKNLSQMYVSRLMSATDNTLKSALEVDEFTKECLEICWYMVVQDPPVSFAKLTCKGSIFNTDLYKAYTRSGSHVDYVVWPPLLLHDNGPVLMKGVAQGIYETAQIKQNTHMLSYI